jgi:glycosyltransferase involved in cell wall biosynthesis
MQTKVSIVTTCYNKEGYIQDMLESVIAQSWDNIELILVNDGTQIYIKT